MICIYQGAAFVAMNTADCPKFQKLSVEDRWAETKKRRLCLCCLKANHSSTVCRRKKACGKDDCQRRHHPLLHEINNPSTKLTTATTPGAASTTTSSSTSPIASTSRQGDAAVYVTMTDVDWNPIQPQIRLVVSQLDLHVSPSS